MHRSPWRSPFEKARTGAIKIDKEAMGNAKDARTTSNQNGARSGWIRLAIPGDQYESTLVKIKALGPLYGESRQSADLLSEIEELDLRANRL